jgi:hypothetical protein
MKKRKFKPYGILFLDPAKFEEPIENPLDLPLTLTCGAEVWKRWEMLSHSGVIYSAIYCHPSYRWGISIDLPGSPLGRGSAAEGFWVFSIEGPVHGEPCKTFGEALALTRQGHRRL